MTALDSTPSSDWRPVPVRHSDGSTADEAAAHTIARIGRRWVVTTASGLSLGSHRRREDALEALRSADPTAELPEQEPVGFTARERTALVSAAIVALAALAAGTADLVLVLSH